MTEDEAKTKICCGPQPAARLTGRCIASACMAWRWKFIDTTPLHASSMGGYPPQQRTYQQTDSGNCGLAGAQP